MDIGKRLFEIRTAKGMTRYRLTQITGVSGHHIKGIETGTRQPTIDTLQKLVEPLGITLAEPAAIDVYELLLPIVSKFLNPFGMIVPILK